MQKKLPDTMPKTHAQRFILLILFFFFSKIVWTTSSRRVASLKVVFKVKVALKARAQAARDSTSLYFLLVVVQFA